MLIYVTNLYTFIKFIAHVVANKCNKIIFVQNVFSLLFVSLLESFVELVEDKKTTFCICIKTNCIYCLSNKIQKILFQHSMNNGSFGNANVVAGQVAGQDPRIDQFNKLANEMLVWQREMFGAQNKKLDELAKIIVSTPSSAVDEQNSRVPYQNSQNMLNPTAPNFNPNYISVPLQPPPPPQNNTSNSIKPYVVEQTKSQNTLNVSAKTSEEPTWTTYRSDKL